MAKADGFIDLPESEKGEIKRFEKGQQYHHIRHPRKTVVNKPHEIHVSHGNGHYNQKCRANLFKK
tara:strand:+ start:467 stop:661 length:195 start_codon:yes stop_codon:yes gene_type:complete